MNSATSRNRMQIAELLTQAAIGLSVWLAVLLLIEYFPKDPAKRDTIRLLLVWGYFVAAIGLCQHLRHAGPQVFWALFRWKYEDAPPDMDKAMKNLVEEIEYFIRYFTWILTVLLATTAVIVLDAWFPMPGLVLGLTRLAWWGSVVMLCLFAYWAPASAMKIVKHSRFLHRQASVCDFYQPRRLADFWRLRPSDPDKKFFLLPPADGFVIGNRPWRLSKLRENVAVFGSIGSGKTVCVMNAFLDHLIASHGAQRPLGGLILDYKGEFYEKTVALCRRHGRTEDLIVLSHESPHAWNPLDSNQPASEIAARFVATMKALGQKDRNTSFFADQAETVLENALLLLRHTSPGGLATVADVYRVVNDFDFLQDRLDHLPSAQPQAGPFDAPRQCRRYFEQVYDNLPEETRQSVVATLNNMLTPLCTEQIAPITGRASTVDLAAAANGRRLFYLHLPSSRSPKAGRVLGLLLKLAFQAEVKNKPLDSRQYSFLFADEFQEFFTGEGDTSDTRFFSVSRQYDHLNLVATQNINNFLMLGDKPESVQSFLSSTKTKIFLQNSDKQTNEYASALFGNYLAEFGGDHIGAQAQLVPNVSVTDFLRLRTPEPGTCSYCESFVLDEAASKVDIHNRTARWPVHPIPLP